MTFNDAQQDFRHAYVNGGPGITVSGVIWLAAALVADRHGVSAGFGTLFFGGMLIHPVSATICRALYRRAPASSHNPLNGTAIESTVMMIGGLIAAWLFMPLRAEFVFPVAAIAAGTRYALFRTLYNDRVFWLLAALMTGIGLLAIFRPGLLPITTPLTIGAIELVFGVAVTARARKISASPR